MVRNARRPERWCGTFRPAPVLLMAAVAASTVACSSATASDGSVESSAPAVVSSTVSATAEPPLLDERAARFKDSLAEWGLAAGLTDGTVLAVARGLCDQVAAGVPDEAILATVRPIAAYAASVSGNALSDDDAARRFVDTAVGVYC
ncbi:DUF732 domain-containing protein [Rhodococcus phenolicus]|uniref:DUF732 domain-containing protein n=1 Tax=Rhodococcus phenolicus TaxID=263849 RepID=UPI000B000BE3|nr:DUF732 domain-containing protein [Rhodococcus phenolicus]